MIGKCKWWNDSKGYGFIEAEGYPELFTHYTALEMEGFKTLAEGQTVEFKVLEGPKGPQAMSVSVVMV